MLGGDPIEEVDLMNPRRFTPGLALAVATTGLLIWAPLAGTRSQPAYKWGAVANGLQMSLRPGPKSPEAVRAPQFNVEIRNIGDKDLLLVLGTMLSNGEKQYPDALRVLLTNAQGETLDCQDPILLTPVGGWIGPLIVPLSVGASYSVPVDLNKWTTGWKLCYGPRKTPPLTNGKYTVRVQYAANKDYWPAPGILRPRSSEPDQIFWAGTILMPKWLGEVTSNSMSFEVRGN
jgi:hypothetical protein